MPSQLPATALSATPARTRSNRHPVSLEGLSLWDVELTVSATYHHGFPANETDDAEPAGYVVDAVYLRGVEITDLIGELEMETITDRVNGRD